MEPRAPRTSLAPAFEPAQPALAATARAHRDRISNSSPSSYFLVFLVLLAFHEFADFLELLVVVRLGSPALAKELFRIRQRQAVVIVDLLLFFILFFVPSFRLPEVAEGEVVVLNLFFFPLFVLAHGLLIRDRFLTCDDRRRCRRVTVVDRLVVNNRFVCRFISDRFMKSDGSVMSDRFMVSDRFVMSDGLVTGECFLVGDRLRVCRRYFGDSDGVGDRGRHVGQRRRNDRNDGRRLADRGRNGCRDCRWRDLGLHHDRWRGDSDRSRGDSDQWRGDGDLSLGDGGRGAGWRTARRKQVVGDAIVLGRHPPAADFDPEIVTASCRDDREMLAGEFRSGRQFVLNGAEFVERALQLGRQELAHDPIHRVERQATARQLDLTRRRDDVRLFAGVHHQRFAVDLQNRLQ